MSQFDSETRAGLRRLIDRARRERLLEDAQRSGSPGRLEVLAAIAARTDLPAAYGGYKATPSSSARA
jgi:hypothetical protein